MKDNFFRTFLWKLFILAVLLWTSSDLAFQLVRLSTDFVMTFSTAIWIALDSLVIYLMVTLLLEITKRKPITQK